MTHYETTIIFSPEVPADKLDELIEKIKKLVENSEGTVVIQEKFGRKKLAYPIKKFQDGFYMYFELSGTGKTISAVETFCKVNDVIIRYLTIKKVKKAVVPVKPETAKAEAAGSSAPQAKPEVKEVKANDDKLESPAS